MSEKTRSWAYGWVRTVLERLNRQPKSPSVRAAIDALHAAEAALSAAKRD